MQEELPNVSYKRGLPEINSCITGFIQYKPTNNMTNKLKIIKAPPSKKVWSFELLSSVDFWRMAWKFWFIFCYKTRLSYLKIKNIEALTGELTRSFYFFKIWKIFILMTLTEGLLELSKFLKINLPFEY